MLLQGIAAKFILSFVIGSIVSAIKKFDTDFDWAKLKADLSERVARFIPGEMFDDEAIAFVSALIDYADKVLDKSDVISAVLEKLAAQDWAGAVAALKDLILKDLEARKGFKASGSVDEQILELHAA
jgi:hypothetical protein